MNKGEGLWSEVDLVKLHFLFVSKTVTSKRTILYLNLSRSFVTKYWKKEQMINNEGTKDKVQGNVFSYLLLTGCQP